MPSFRIGALLEDAAKTVTLGYARMYCDQCRAVTDFRVRRQGETYLVTCTRVVPVYEKQARNKESIASICLNRIEESTRVAVAIARARTKEST